MRYQKGESCQFEIWIFLIGRNNVLKLYLLYIGSIKTQCIYDIYDIVDRNQHSNFNVMGKIVFMSHVFRITSRNGNDILL